MRYYVYVSDAKLDMMYEQIPAKLSARLAGELKVDLKVVSLTVRTNSPAETRDGRVRLVEEYIDRNYEVGWVTDPTQWFRGELSLRTGVFRPMDADDGLIYFGCVEDDLLVGLVGSARHRVGQRSDPARPATHFSSLPALCEVMEADSSGSPDFERSSSDHVAHEAAGLTSSLRGPAEPMEFLARRLLHTTITGYGSPLKVVLATPLYVALLDD